MSVRTITMAAGVAQEFFEVSDFFRLLEATYPVDLTFFNNQAVAVSAESVKGGYSERFLNGKRFERVQIKSSQNQTVQFVTRLENQVGYDVPPTGQVVISNTSGPFVQNSIAVTTTSTLLAAAKVGRRYLLVQNNHVTAYIWVKVNGSTATSGDAGGGIKVYPGGSVEFQSFCPTGDIYAISDTVMGAGYVLVVEG